MKILLCSDSYYPHTGGVSEYMYFLAKHLTALGHETVILAPHYSEPYPDTARTKRIGRCYFFSGNMATITITIHPRLPILVRNFISQEQFDVVHTNGPLGWTLPYWAFHYARSLNVATFHTAFAGLNLYTFAKVVFKREFQKRLHGVIYPSFTAMETTYPHFPLPYRIIPNGIDIERFNPQIQPLEKFPSDRPKILFVGRLDPRKGLDRLLAAYPRVKKRIKDAMLIIVGWGPLLTAYKQMIPHEMRDSVFFEGKVSYDLIPRYYASCDVYVSPATGGEVFGIVLTEAMASGKPVIASRIPGYDDVVSHGNNGLLVDHNNPDELADAIVRVLEDKTLRRVLGTKGREFALGISWETIARHVLEYYQDLIEKRG